MARATAAAIGTNAGPAGDGTAVTPVGYRVTPAGKRAHVPENDLVLGRLAGDLAWAVPEPAALLNFHAFTRRSPQ